MVRSAPPTCPDCPNSPGAIEVLYGFPSAEAFEAADRGDVVLGGCEPPRDGELSEWVCPECRRPLG